VAHLYSNHLMFLFPLFTWMLIGLIVFIAKV
jgi:hypothetical protein